jgi:NAD(P)-dependent dehydrogenase (short-subunit alcohol dehydrogenase family)
MSAIDLRGHVALVTGGSRGLGRAFAMALGKAGAAVAVAARSPVPLDDARSALELWGAQAMAVPLDVTDRAAVTAGVAAIETTLGPIDILINAAGIMAPLGRDWEVEPRQWWRTMEVNVYGSFLCWNAVLPRMIERRRGRIINISSAAARKPYPYYSAYGASKAALSHATASVAEATREFGISIFAYAPGFVRTTMTEELADAAIVRQALGSGFRRALDEGRTTPLEVCTRVLLQLASGAADTLSGRHIDVGDDVGALLAPTDVIELMPAAAAGVAPGLRRLDALP